MNTIDANKIKLFLKGIEKLSQRDFKALGIKRICCDSRIAREGDLFIALKGTVCDGHDFLKDVALKGVKFAVVERNTPAGESLLQLIVPDTHSAAVVLADNFYGSPSKRLNVVGITGTNGKTTTSFLIGDILRACGKSPGLIGTIFYDTGEKVSSINTTPGPLHVQDLMRRMVDNGMSHAVMEVSSHGLVQRRVDKVNFDIAVLTNISSDHLDYHKDHADYVEAKSRLFKLLKPKGTAVLNGDDQFCKIMEKATRGNVLTYGLGDNSHVRASKVRLKGTGSTFVVTTPKGKLDIETRLIGMYNVYNILAAIGVGVVENLNLELIEDGIRNLDLVPGRMERIDRGQPFNIFVDYAHTDDALDKALSALRGLTKGRLVALFGCGGDRDSSKRARMGSVASRMADISILTSDNPRSEDPRHIIREIEAGFEDIDRYVIHVDRRDAIRAALETARQGDTVLIAGKGHENYQIIGEEHVSFDDRVVVREVLSEIPVVIDKG